MNKQRNQQIDVSGEVLPCTDPAALAGMYLRSIAMSLESFEEFDDFIGALVHLVGEDRYLKGSAQLCDVFSGASESPDFEELPAEETVIAVAGPAGNHGYLKYTGRADGHRFSAEDLHLMGAISSVISALVAQAQHFRQKQQAASILEYLMNQLPLGVVCFDGGGSVLIENKRAQSLLGSSGAALLASQLARGERVSGGLVKLHLEVDDKLIYCEGRSLEVAEDLVVDAYVLYDLSASREQLLKDLELEVYMSESRGGSLVVALLESRGIAGDMYRKVQSSATDFGLGSDKIQPLDAYTCACVFRGRDVRSVRRLLRGRLTGFELEDLRISIVAYDASTSALEPAQEFIDGASTALARPDESLPPELLVLEVYLPVVQSLELILGELCRLRSVGSVGEADALIRSGQVDGLVLDVDGYNETDRVRLQQAALSVGADFKVFYSSYKQPLMARSTCALPEEDTLFQKPFDAIEIADSVRSQFNLA